MNRRQLKAASKQSLRDAVGHPKCITLVFLLSLVALVGLNWGLEALVSHMGTGHQYLSATLAAQSRNFLITLVSSLVMQLVVLMLCFGYSFMALGLSQQEEVFLSDLLEGFRLWYRFLPLYLLTAVYLSLWSSVLSMPVSFLLSWLYLSEILSYEMVYALLMGYVVLVMFIFSYRYRTSWFVLLEHPEMPLTQVLREAYYLTRGYRMQLFLLDLSFLPWLVLCACTGGILLIWKLPYIVTTYAHTYATLKRINPKPFHKPL